MRFRVLAPAGGFASPWDILKTWSALRQQPVSGGLVRSLEARLGAVTAEALAFGSGKEALYRLFQLLGQSRSRPLVAVSAYTCPDIAAAAARAGCRVLPLDVSDSTLEPDPSALLPATLAGIAAVVLSNLYGLPDSLSPWLELSQKHSFLLVDDACQAALSRRNGIAVGRSSGTVGVLSFGRGKGICGTGGGALLLNASAEPGLSADSAAVLATLRRVQAETPCSILRGQADLLRGAAAWLLERPWLYGAVRLLPGLHLGETHCSLDFDLGPISDAQALYALTQLERSMKTAALYVEHASRWSARLSSLPLIQPFLAREHRFDGAVVPIRYPVLFRSSRARDKALSALERRGLGASSSYPSVLQGFGALSGALVEATTPKAEEVSRRILTLPVHQYLVGEDIDSTGKILEEFSS